MFGGEGADDIEAGDGDDIVDGLAGDDEIIGGLGTDALFGGNGDDTLYAAEETRDPSVQDSENLAFGGAGNDALYGGSAQDVLLGGSGDDTIEGREGDDIIWLHNNAQITPPQFFQEIDNAYATVDAILTQIGAPDPITDTFELSKELSEGGIAQSFAGPAGADTIVFHKGDNSDSIYNFSSDDGFEIHGYDRENAVFVILNPIPTGLPTTNQTAKVVFYETHEQAAIARKGIAEGGDINAYLDGQTGDQFIFFDSFAPDIQLDDWVWGL